MKKDFEIALITVKRESEKLAKLSEYVSDFRLHPK
jgi:hypothetical protein